MTIFNSDCLLVVGSRVAKNHDFFKKIKNKIYLI